MEQIPIGDPPSNNVVPLRSEQPGATRDQPTQPDTASTRGSDDEDMSWEEVIARDATSEPPPEPDTGAPADAELIAMLEQIVRVGLGLTVGVVDALAASLRRSDGRQTQDGASGDEPFEALIGAALGAAVMLAELVPKVISSLSRTLETGAAGATGSTVFEDLTRGAGSAVRVLDGVWRSKEAEARASAETFMTELVSSIAAKTVDMLDLTTLIRESVDLDAIVAGLDLDALLARVDFDAVLDRIDVERFARRLPATTKPARPGADVTTGSDARADV